MADRGRLGTGRRPPTLSSRRLASRVLLALTLTLALLLAGDGARGPSPGADAAAGRAGAIRAALTEAARLAHGISRGQARLVYEAALRQAELAADRNAQAAALAGLGDLVSPRQYHGRALALYRRSEHLATGPQADLSVARVHFATGVEEASRLRWAEADRHYQAALILLQRRGDLAMLARVEDAIGNAAIRQGDPARAERAYQASLQSSRRAGDLAAIARTLDNLSLVDALRGDRSHQRALLESALAAARAAGDRDRIATALNSLGSFHLNAADYEQALDCFEQAVAVHPEDEAELAYSLNDLGIVLAEQSEDGLAVERFERSLSLLEKVGDSYGIVRLVDNLGAVCQEKGEYARALQYHVRGSPWRSFWPSVGS
jgi:tetratricopeptide (TPR) repeat protein